MMAFKIAQTEAERQACINIRTDVFVEEQGVPLENEIDDKENVSTHFLGYIDGKPVVTARIRPYDNGYKVERVATLASYRGQGLGRALMIYVAQYAESQGIQRLILNAQVQAQLFYEKLGYTAEGDTFLEEDILHVKMTKIL